MKRQSKSKKREKEVTTPYYKIIIIGENEVGKTQLMHRLNDENFDEKYSPTYGIDFRIKSIVEDKNVKCDLQILDIAGENDEAHLKIEDDFIKDAHAFLCLFDLSDQSSLDRAIKIMDNYKEKIKGENVNASSKIWYLIGNKKDLDLKREGVPNYYKAKFGNYFEVSAKTSKDEEFQRIIDVIIHDIDLIENESRFHLQENFKSSNEPFEIDFKKNHENIFDEECNIF